MKGGARRVNGDEHGGQRGGARGVALVHDRQRLLRCAVAALDKAGIEPPRGVRGARKLHPQAEAARRDGDAGGRRPRGELCHERRDLLVLRAPQLLAVLEDLQKARHVNRPLRQGNAGAARVRWSLSMPCADVSG